MQVKTILVPFDFSEYADRALSWAVGLAKDGDAKILLLHVTPPIPAVATANALSFGALAQADVVRLVVPVERQSHLIRVALYPRQERTTVFLRRDQ